MGMPERIKERRLAMNYTQEELAKKLGLQKSAIAKYENGRVENIKRSVIVQMSSILDCSPTYLMGWDEIEKEPETDYELMKALFKRQGVHLAFSASMLPIDESQQLELYWIFEKDIGYRISVEEYHDLKREIDSFVRFKLSELTNENHIIKPIQEISRRKESYTEPQAAHERTDIDVTDEMRKRDDALMDDDNFWNGK